MRLGLPILEDSSLIFAVRLGEAMRRRGWTPIYVHVLERHVSGSKLSERQVAESLGPSGLDAVLTEKEFMSDGFLANFDAVAFARSFREARGKFRRERFRLRIDRPRFVAFLPGLEFTPERGFATRLWFDAVFLNTPADRDSFAAHSRRGGDQHVSWGHPYFLRPERGSVPKPDGAVYFFAQAISPPTIEGRLHLLRALHAIAVLHPERDVVLKLRHLPGENDKHVHQERFSYPWLQERFLPPPPPNLRFEAGPISEALAQAAMALTCTSTAAMDAISAGVPCRIYLDFAESYRDPLVEPMRRLFEGSGAISPLGAMLRLEPSPPPPQAWMDERFRESAAFYDEVDAALRGPAASIPAEAPMAISMAN